MRMPKSNASTMKTPAAIAHSVSVVSFGTTRSYTFMMKSGMTSANTLIRNEPTSTSP